MFGPNTLETEWCLLPTNGDCSTAVFEAYRQDTVIGLLVDHRRVPISNQKERIMFNISFHEPLAYRLVAVNETEDICSNEASTVNFFRFDDCKCSTLYSSFHLGSVQSRKEQSLA